MKKIIGIFLVLALLILGASVYQTGLYGNAKQIIGEAVENLFHGEFYYALANPSVKYVNITEGLRKEQIASALQKRFSWDDKDKKDFLAYDNLRDTKLEGKYFPDVYLVSKNISGADFKKTMFDRFDEKTKKIKDKISKGKINLDTALNIASIIQREAAGKKDMALISGIIWNRIFAGMSLQMDATLQYAKGNEANGWWPVVKSADRKIESPYNTYENKGLPPSPISNPGLAAIEAALAPQKTDCLFYLHKDNQIYCSKTYEEHKKKVEQYLR